MHGDEDRVIPGNALAAQQNTPFRPLTKFGTGFLNKFECSQTPSRILESIYFVDTPGVLSGEKQRIGRRFVPAGVTDAPAPARADERRYVPATTL